MISKLKTVPVDLKRLSELIYNEVVKNTNVNTLKTKINNLEKRIPDTTTLIYINQYNTDKKNLEKKIGDVDKKISEASGLVTATVLNAKVGKVENKIPDHAKYITNQKFKKLTAESVVAGLKQANLVGKTGCDNKLISFNKRITSDKIKHLEVQKKQKQSSLKTKEYNFF